MRRRQFDTNAFDQALVRCPCGFEASGEGTAVENMHQEHVYNVCPLVTARDQHVGTTPNGGTSA